MNRYFESSYLTMEIIPGKNLEFISGEFSHLEYLEEDEGNAWKHADTSHYYFVQRPIGGARPFPILDLNILNAELQSILLSHGLSREQNGLPYVADQFMDPYRQEIQDADRFSNESYAILFSSENNIVKHIWLDHDDYLSTESDRNAIGRLLNCLGEKYSFILIDWYEKHIVDLSNKETILQFLNDTANNSSWIDNLSKD